MRKFSRITQWAIGWMVVTAWGCDDTSTQVAASCVPNETQACLCVDGTEGVQVCEASGAAFTACVCAQGDATPPPSGGETPPPPGGETPPPTGGETPPPPGGETPPLPGGETPPPPSGGETPPPIVDPTFAVCTMTTPSAGNCKDCCDCLAGATCDVSTACRETCDALPPEHFAAQAALAPFVPMTERGRDGDYSACLTTATEQACKACCCDQGLVCGDTRFCRDACNTHDFSGQLPADGPAVSSGPVPPSGGGGGQCVPTEDRYLDGQFGQVVVGDRMFTVPSPVADMPTCTDLYNPCAGGQNPNADADLRTIVLDDGPGARTITGTLYADNAFELWVNGQPLCRDALDYVPFNAHVVRFRASGPLHLAVNLVDAEEALGVGLERGNQVGDGGFAARFVDEQGAVVAETGADWRCTPLYIAPLDDAGCLAGADSSACGAPTCPADNDFSDCHAALFDEPAGWNAAAFDASSWPAARVFAAQVIAPKPAYTNNAARFGAAEFIWSANLLLDNRVLCRFDEPAGGGGGGGGAPLDAAGRCAAIQASVTEAGFGDRVQVDCDGTHAFIRSTIDPDHDVMNGITGTNEQVPVPASYAAPIRLSPVMAAAPTSIDSALGVAVNGVPIFDYSSQGALDLNVYDPAADVVVGGQVDVCNGHAGRGDDYHYHAAPICMMAAMANAGDDAILGWGFDGFPLYGDRQPDGSAIVEGDLDLCNGMADDRFGYRYHTSAAPPYVWQCLQGEVDQAILPRVRPLTDPVTRMGRPAGMPPRGGVQQLRFVRDALGGAEMTYTYNGQPYFIRYTPSARAGCYTFDTRTVTSGAQQGEYCRGQ